MVLTTAINSSALRNRFKCILISLLSLAACRETETAQSIGENYFPIELGKEFVFKIDSFHFNSFENSVDSFTYFERENVVELLSDSGKKNYLTTVERRGESIEPWQFSHYVVYGKSNLALERTMANLTITKLVFPVKRNKNWDGNQNNYLSL